MLRVELVDRLACAQDLGSLTRSYPDFSCTSCTEWNLSQAPFRIHGNSYFVGTHGLSSILITSPEGHILIDAALPNSAPLILENIRSLGFDPAVERFRAAAAVLAPLRHPLLMARELGTLDLLSEGRLLVQPTVSWSRDEYDGPQPSPHHCKDRQARAARG